MTELLKNNTPYLWDDKTDKAFNTLKEFLITQQLLQYPDFKRPFVLTADASNEATGAVLGRDLPIVYASRTSNSVENNYPTVEKKLLSIFWDAITFDNTCVAEKLL